ncbi:MAG: hypothetical protein LLF94_10450 [Chlamydiales bacterium]|nr:hypothetical protein [Chlamydiales bacterium]
MAALEGNRPNVGGPQSTGANYQIVETTTKGEFKLFINGEPHTLKVGGKEVTGENQLKRLVSVFEKTIGNVPVLKEGQVLKLSAKTGIQIKDTNTKTVTQLKFKDATAETKFASRLDKLVQGTAMNTKGLSIEKAHTSGADTPKRTHTESGRPLGTDKSPKMDLSDEADEPKVVQKKQDTQAEPAPEIARQMEPVMDVPKEHQEAVPQGVEQRAGPPIPEPEARPVTQEAKPQEALSSLAFFQHLAEDTSKNEAIPADEPPPPPPDDDLDKDEAILKNYENEPAPAPPAEHDATEISAEMEPEALDEPEENTETADDIVSALKNFAEQSQAPEVPTEAHTEAPEPQPAPPPPPPPPPPPVTGARGALLAEIAEGKDLKHVETSEKKVVLTEEEQRMAKFRAAVAGDDEDEETEEIGDETPRASAEPEPSKTPEPLAEKPTVASPGRGALLEEIVKGKKLKTVTPSTKEPVKEESSTEETVGRDALSKSFDNMRGRRIEPKTTEPPPSDDDADWT